MVSLVETLIDLEDDPNWHAARLLILLKAFGGRQGTLKIRGLTKLVKLDFLLRYPVYFERALEAKGISSDIVKIKEYERKSVESSMIRYYYGPWDPRYRIFVNFLVGKGLSEVEVSDRTILIGLTPMGVDLASKISESRDFADITQRAQILKQHFNIGAMNLKDFIYETFPEIVSLKLGETIE
jgi:hypothetical protein